MPRFMTRPPSGRDGRTLSLVTFVQSVGYGSFAACGAISTVHAAGRPGVPARLEVPGRRPAIGVSVRSRFGRSVRRAISGDTNDAHHS